MDEYASSYAGWHHARRAKVTYNPKRGCVEMIVRVASVRVAPERIDEMVSHYRETLRSVHEKCQGLRHHYWLVSRGTAERSG